MYGPYSQAKTANDGSRHHLLHGTFGATNEAVRTANEVDGGSPFSPTSEVRSACAVHQRTTDGSWVQRGCPRWCSNASSAAPWTGLQLRYWKQPWAVATQQLHPHSGDVPEFVPKKDDSWRMCVDSKAVNKITIKLWFLILQLDDLPDQYIAWYYCFICKIDLQSRYHQIRMRPEDE